MPKSWPADAVAALNHHYGLVGVPLGGYEYMLAEYTGTLALAVPWVRRPASQGGNPDSEVGSFFTYKIYIY